MNAAVLLPHDVRYVCHQNPLFPPISSACTGTCVCGGALRAVRVRRRPWIRLRIGSNHPKASRNYQQLRRCPVAWAVLGGCFLGRLIGLAPHRQHGARAVQPAPPPPPLPPGAHGLARPWAVNRFACLLCLRACAYSFLCRPAVHRLKGNHPPGRHRPGGCLHACLPSHCLTVSLLCTTEGRRAPAQLSGTPFR